MQLELLDVAEIVKITHVAEIVKLSHVAEIVKLTHVARILEAGSMYDPSIIFNLRAILLTFQFCTNPNFQKCGTGIHGKTITG